MTEGAGRSPSRRAAFWDVCPRPVLSLLPRESVSPAAPGASVGAAGVSVPEPTAAREVGFSVTLLRAALGRFLGTDIVEGPVGVVRDSVLSLQEVLFLTGFFRTCAEVCL